MLSDEQTVRAKEVMYYFLTILTWPQAGGRVVLREVHSHPRRGDWNTLKTDDRAASMGHVLSLNLQPFLVPNLSLHYSALCSI